MIKEKNIPLLDADDIVYELYQKGSSILNKIKSFTTVHIIDTEGNIDRHALSKIIKENPNLLSKIEDIVHPAVRQNIQKWLKIQYANNTQYVFLSVPLMFDAGFNLLCDTTITCNTKDAIRKQRFMLREKSTEEKWQLIQSKQLSNDTYIKKSDYVISTDTDIIKTEKNLSEILNKIKSMPAKAYLEKWSKL